MRTSHSSTNTTPYRAVTAERTTWTTCNWYTGGATMRTMRGPGTGRQRLEPDDEQSSRPVLRGLGLGNEARLPDTSRCGCATSSKPCWACAPWSRCTADRSSTCGPTSNGCGTCSGTATTRRRPRPWAGSRAGRKAPPRSTAAKAGRLLTLCAGLRAYIGNNEGALIDYGRRYRAGKPISTSRAEGTVNNLVNARMNKRGQMRSRPAPASRANKASSAAKNGLEMPFDTYQKVSPEVGW